MPDIADIIKHQRALARCRLCTGMTPPVVICQPIVARIVLIGQAPGDKEPQLKRPFAWTAGKTLFKWFDSIGLGEDDFRQQVYMTAVCRCFPGKSPQGGDRVPDADEIANCSRWLNAELDLLQPELVLLVGKLAIAQYMPVDKLVDVIGQRFRMKLRGRWCDVIPLPHPSGASTWHRMLPGKQLLQDALALIAQHPAWRRALRRVGLQR
jgi:uracil-DNA glycosylase